MLEGNGYAAYSSSHRDALMRFILFWGEMASRWGINRTMAQIHALLYASEDPLDTDEIMQLLQISRGNANMNLRSLINWNLVRKVHQPGSRKDFYSAEKDVWKITARVIKEREKREIQPVMQQLQECREVLLDSNDDTKGKESSLSGSQKSIEDFSEKEQQFCTRIDNLIELMEVFEGFSKALFPFIQERSIAEAKQLIQMAGGLSGSMFQDSSDEKEEGTS